MARNECNLEPQADSTVAAEIRASEERVKATGITRRNFLQTSGVAAAVVAAGAVTTDRLFGAGHSSAPALRQSSSALAGANDALAIAKDAYVWGFPLVYNVRLLQLARENNAPVNRFVLSTGLSTPAVNVAGPNVDTLYGYAWLDLSKEPQILFVPDTNGRYYSIQLIDAYFNTFTYVGRRVTGTAAGKYALVGPGWTGTIPQGVTRIDAPTNHVLAFTRTLVSGDMDLAAANAIQIQYGLLPLSAYPQTPQPPITPEAALTIFPILRLTDRGPQFFDDLSVGLLTDPPPSSDGSSLDRFATIGIGPNQLPLNSQSPAVLSALSDAVPAAEDLIRKADFSTSANGWGTDYGITNFIKDPLHRAKTSVYGPGAHVAQEALYFSPVRLGQLLSGATNYSLKFAAGGLPPVDAFWSLTLYDQNFLLVANPINRYSIGDRTAGLEYGADGSLELFIQHGAPAQGTSNWLPAPAGPYQLVLRTYQPRPAIFNGDYKLPPLQHA